MSELTDKERFLEHADYRYHFDRMIYFNRNTRRAFSLEFVEDNSLQVIQDLLGQPTPAQGWILHFNDAPSERVQRELIEALGG
jgi:hypothetical protein